MQRNPTQLALFGPYKPPPDKRQQRINELASAKTGLLFPIILADPPWQYEFEKSKSRGLHNHYPTMTHEQIMSLPVQALAYKEAMLFLWSTTPGLDRAMEVISAWGFTYCTNMVWVKDKQGLGWRSRNQHELLLLGKRGSFPTPDPSRLQSSVFHAPRREHSRKPEAVAEMIEAQFPDMAKLELFCREPRPGWSVWGNEVASDIAM